VSIKRRYEEDSDCDTISPMLKVGLDVKLAPSIMICTVDVGDFPKPWPWIFGKWV